MTTTLTSQLPPIAAICTGKVADFDAWTPKFDAATPQRKEAGVLGHHIDRSADDPCLAVTYLAASDRARLEGLLLAPEIKARLKEVGVTEVEHTIVVPQEDRTVRSGTHASAMTSFDVEDYARWKAAFDAGAETRRRATIVGHAVAREAERPNRVTVYLQAESAEKLRALLTSDELREGMRRAGASTPPAISYLRDLGLWAQY
jgi:hypothetical protein